MQNFFLNPVLRDHPNGLQAYDKLISSTIPTCQRAGIDIIFVNWGLTQYDLATIPPMIHRSFSKDVVNVMPLGIAPQPHTQPDAGISGSAKRLYVGLGKDLGDVDIPIPRVRAGEPTGTAAVEEERATIHAGLLLMRGSWNAMLYGELDLVYRRLRGEPDLPRGRIVRNELVQKKTNETKAFLVHKNRLSGLWGQTTPFEELLHTLGVKTLLFAGVNTDQ